MARHRLAAALGVMLLVIACVPLGTATVRAQAPVAAPAEVAALAGQHPAEYYRRAAALLQGDRKDDAVFVYYLGQLRYRVHLAARRTSLKPDGDPALFASLSEVVGRPINEYAFGDIPALARIIDAVLAYDLANPDTFTPPSQFPDMHRSVRDGLATLRTRTLDNAEAIRAKRRENGLPSRN